MRTSGKKLVFYTSRNSSVMRKELSSKLPLRRNKNGCKISSKTGYKCRLNPHLKNRRRRKNNLEGKSMEAIERKSGHSSVKYSYSLHSMRSSGNSNTPASDSATKSIKRKRGRRKRKDAENDDASRLQGRARYLLIKIKLEQNLIDAYSGEGWKGQSREKIKPEKELQRAEKQILKCKLGIRDVIRQLDLLSSIGSIEDSVIYPDGSVSHEHIFCAKCKSREAFPDNDIILCDGTCNCGFHQKCLEPPLDKMCYCYVGVDEAAHSNIGCITCPEDVPPGDQGWLCKFCESKMKILEAINAHLCTNFTLECTSEDIFKEATGHPDADNSYLDPAGEWPSEDSEDEDYNPEIYENRNSRASSEDYVSGDSSISGSQLYSLDEVMSYYELESHGDQGVFCPVKCDSNTDNSIANTDFGESNDCEILSYRRQRRDVDYRKLHDEMFGKDFSESEQQSEDEDWGPHRRKHRRIESSAGPGLTDPVEDGCSKMTSADKLLSNKKLLFRIPASAVKELRQVFAENELPSRAVKENLSKQLGISSEKVSKWFKNARYAALKIRKAKLTSHMTDVAKESRTRAGEAGCFDLMDNSYFLPLSEIIRVPKKMSRILQRKKPKSAGSILRKQHKEATNAKPAEDIQFFVDSGTAQSITEQQLPVMSDKRSMLNEPGLLHSQVHTSITNIACRKRWLSGRRRRNYLKKTNEAKERPDSQVDKMINNDQLYISVIENLCSVQNRLQNLKEALLLCKNTDNLLSEKRVMYVPIAEVKDKV